MTGMVPAVADTKPNLGQFCQAYANFRPTGRSYLDLAKDANVKVIDYTDGMLRKQHVKQLTVEVAVDQSGSRGQVTNRLVFSFRTDLRWVCVGCQGVSLKGNHDKNWEDIYNYTQSPDGWPVPKSFETYSYSDNTSPDGRLESLLEFVKFVRSPVPFPDADFTLSAFGFPEPVNLPERQAVDPVRPLVGDDVLAPPLDRPSRWPLWLALAAGGLVITGVGLAVRRRLGRRRAVAA